MGQFSASWRVASNTTLEAGWGRYAQLPQTDEGAGVAIVNGLALLLGDLPYRSTQTLAAVEQRLGERTRLRFEVFDRQNESRVDVSNFQVLPGHVVITPLVHAAPFTRDYSRGLQVVLQRRSENGLSGWIAYTFTQARDRYLLIPLPAPLPPCGFDTP